MSPIVEVLSSESISYEYTILNLCIISEFWCLLDKIRSILVRWPYSNIADFDSKNWKQGSPILVDEAWVDEINFNNSKNVQCFDKIVVFIVAPRCFQYSHGSRLSVNHKIYWNLTAKNLLSSTSYCYATSRKMSLVCSAQNDVAGVIVTNFLFKQKKWSF